MTLSLTNPEEYENNNLEFDLEMILIMKTLKHLKDFVLK